MLTQNKRCGISFQAQTAITVFCIAALTLTAQAGDFIHIEGELRDGGYAGRVDLGELSDYQSGPGQPDYPGSIYRVVMNPYPSVQRHDIGYGVCEFSQLGWAAETSSEFFPEMGIIRQGKVKFEMGSQAFAWAGVYAGVEPQDFSVGTSLLGSAYVESTTSAGGLSYELQSNSAFDEEFDDYIRVNIYMNLTREVCHNNEPYDEPYSDFHVDLDSNAIGAGGDNFQVLRNDEVVWEEGIDGWFDPSMSISIDARFGDVISLNGGVVSEVRVNNLTIEDGDSWSGLSKITLAGQMGVSPIQGSKSSYPLMPENYFTGPPWHFEPIDLCEKESELGIDDPLWLAAPSAEGFLIEVEGSTFTGVEFAEIGDCLFDVYLIDEVTGELVLLEEDFYAGDTLYLPPGTEAFVVLGIEDDIMYPFGAPIGLLFDSLSYPSVTFTPIPEPATLLLLATGGGLTLLRRRRIR